MSTKSKIAQLVALSLTKGKLDGAKIQMIVKRLSEKEIRLYYKLLVTRRNKEKVTVTAAFDVPKNFALRIQKLISDKDVFFTKDEHILAGIKVTVSDFVFNATMRAYMDKVKGMYANENN